MAALQTQYRVLLLRTWILVELRGLTQINFYNPHTSVDGHDAVFDAVAGVGWHGVLATHEAPPAPAAAVVERRHGQLE